MVMQRASDTPDLAPGLEEDEDTVMWDQEEDLLEDPDGEFEEGEE